MADPIFNSPTTNPFSLTNIDYNAAPLFADIDGDGDLDAFVSNGNAQFYRNTGTASNPVFAAPVSNPFGINKISFISNLTLVDIDQDGDLDAFVGNDASLFYRNSGTAVNPVFDAPVTNAFGLTTVPVQSGLTFVDIDGDGDLDAFISDSYFGNTKLYTNTGTASNPAFTVAASNPPGLQKIGVANLSFTDIDSDGDFDAIVGTSLGNTLVYRNIGTASQASFSAPITNPFGLADVGYYANPTFADIDGDGDLDALVGNGDGDILFFNNNPNNIAPTLSTFAAAVGSGLEDTPVTIGFADLIAQGNQADVDGSVNRFIIKSVSSGSLKIGTSANTATAWNASTNNTVDATHTAYWTPDANANGILNAFTVVAKDNNGSESVGAVQATVAITGINDAPSFTAFVSTVANGIEDTTTAISFAQLQSQANAADVDGTVTSYIVKAVTTGSLKIGASLETATAWNAATNNVVDASHSAFWTPVNNANGILNAFTVVAKDNNGLESSSPIQANVAVATVNDAPTLTAFASSVANGNEDSPVTITFANLQSQGNEADLEGSVDSFVIKSVSSGTLTIGTSANTATAWNATTNNTVDATHLAFWTPASNANGTLNAFTVVAKDNAGLESVTPVQVTVAVATVNDAPPTLTAPAPINYTDTQYDDTFANATGTLSATDSEGEILSYGITGGTDNGDGTVSASNTYGVLTVTKATGAYRFVANDAAMEALTAAASASFMVTATNKTFTDSKQLSINIAQNGTTESIGNDKLNGTTANDRFDGLTGADTMTGGVGDDTYTVDNTGDKVVEKTKGGTDTVISSISYTLGANLENLVLTGTTAINGTGNTANNNLTGNAAANTLNGGKGIDTLAGGAGDDIYALDNTADKVIENANAGTDSVISSVSYTLGANVENLTLTGTAALKGTGNELDNVIIGNKGANTLVGAAGNDLLDGGAGKDVLTGGAGNDIFRFADLSKDTITDYSVADDTIQLENSVFTKLAATGQLSADNFKVGSAAADANDYLIYNNETGALYYDNNGNASGGVTQIALLGTQLGLTHADFFVI